MPNYTYKCDACDHTWEAVYTMAEYKKPCGEPCPECEAMNTVVKAVDGFARVQVDTNHDWTKTKNLPGSFRERMNTIADGLPNSSGTKSRMKDQFK